MKETNNNGYVTSFDDEIDLKELRSKFIIEQTWNKMIISIYEERILIDEMPVIPIYTYVRAYQLSPDVKGFYPNYLDHHHPKTIYLERE